MKNFDNKIQKAKETPLESLYKGELKKIGTILRGKCPFHDDNGKPNFTIWPNTNKWKCFACNKGGDAIDYYMLAHNVEFREAVEQLS